MQNKPGKSIVLLVAFIRLTRTIIDLELENYDFIEFVMQPFCFFMMKEVENDDH